MGIKFEAGNLCMVTGGRNTGRVGTIMHRERHPGSFDIVHVKDSIGHTFAALTNHENVAHAGSKSMTNGILNVHNIERTRMSFSVHDGSHTTSVATSSDHAQVSSLEFDGIHDFASVDVQPNRIIGLYNGIGVANCSAIRGVQVGNIFGSCLDFTDTA